MLRQQEADAVGNGQSVADTVCAVDRAGNKNVEMWDKMQAATRDAFIGRGADDSKPAGQRGENQDAKRQQER
jgi:deferrochelatase/peroxidase EfeB